MADTYTVKKGDCLWDIAYKYLGSGTRWLELAVLNNIPAENPTIYPGQVLNMKVSQLSSSSHTYYDGPTNMCSVKFFGLQAGTDRTMFATWTWCKEHTKEYRVKWHYCTEGQPGIWFVGSDSRTNEQQSVYTAPSNANGVLFLVMPVSETYKVNDQDVDYWTGNWSSEKTYYFSQNPPSVPSVPDVKIKDYKLTATLSNLDINADKVQFQVVKDNATVYSTGTSSIITGSASYSCNVAAGSEYKVRCRGVRGNIYGGWSDYSNNAGTEPAASSGITVCRANSATSVYLEWGAVSNCTSYDLEYATKLSYFDGSDQTSTVTGISNNHYEKTGLESGQQYFFRVRAVNDNGKSAWTGIKSVIIGRKPAAPTTWSSTNTAITGDPLTLYWIHNSEDGSNETFAQVAITVDGTTKTYTIQRTTAETEEGKTGSYSVNTSGYKEGAQISWRVRTAGITKDFGDWSVERVVTIYAPPTLELTVSTDKDSGMTDLIESFPFYISAFAGPNTQSPIGYHLSITSNQVYETVDSVGTRKTVNKGEEVYSKYFDTTKPLEVMLSASDVDLENNVQYTVTCVVSMNSGLTTEASSEFTVSWINGTYEPNAEITVDKDIAVAYIRPYCEEYTFAYYKVNNVYGKYLVTSEVLGDDTEGLSVNGVATNEGDIVYYDETQKVYFCIKQSEEGTPIEGILLSVYRREFDGTFTEIAKDLENTSNTFVTDPHPSLNYARYRIIATDKNTGAVSYYDPPGYPINEKAVIIQWSEDWSYFNASEGEVLEQPPWSGSLLRLPYNIDISDNHETDVELVSYVGRKHPVSYYGTQLGETSTWNVDIPKRDIDTLHAIRRLAIWMGNVYVREPSGSGYWASISVSYSQKHCVLTIPVTFNITRVDGGA